MDVVWCMAFMVYPNLVVLTEYLVRLTSCYVASCQLCYNLIIFWLLLGSPLI